MEHIMSVSLNDYIDQIRNSNSYSIQYKKYVREPNEQVQNIQKEMDKFYKKIKSFKSYDSDNFIKSRVKKDLDKLLDTYNSLLKESEKNDNKELKKSINKIEELFETNKFNLKTLGIRKEKNKWKKNDEVFNRLKDYEVRKISNKLFVGIDSFINRADKLCRKATKCASQLEYSTVLRNMNSITTYTDEEIDAASHASELIGKLDEIKKNNNTSIEHMDSILNNFVQSLNTVVTSNIDSTKKKLIIDLNKDSVYSNKLNDLGIECNDNNNMCYTNWSIEDITNNVTKKITLCNTINELFISPGSYSDALRNYSKELINEVLKTDKTGINFDMSV